MCKIVKRNLDLFRISDCVKENQHLLKYNYPLPMSRERNYKALFIEDSPADVYLTKTMIGIDNIPIEAHFIKNAPKALEYLSQLSDDDFPEIIITDVNMPMMNGYEFVQVYRERFHSRHLSTLVFISSSSIRKEDKKLIERLRIVRGYFEKPFSLEAFQKYIQKSLKVPVTATA